ncbi:SUKH-4 family immunity protein [Streptomyces sp. NPDC091292]|uniref:SUKH-4 family immunity protein n=1 Tax=Streptomyces sp. NPDC091292 TaxID=3365991 RepID=UPI00382CFF28
MKYELTEVRSSGGEASIEVPREFFGYVARDVIEVIIDSGGEVLLEFWHLGEDVRVYVQQRTGKVLAGPGPSDLVFANSSISQFNRCVQSLTARYPFAAEDAEPEEWALAALEVEKIVHAIDPPAADDGTFWSDFEAEVSMGDYI